MAQYNEYDSRQKRLIHQLMATVLTGDELNQFTANNFRPVFDQFTPQMDNDARIRMQIEYCAYHNELGRLVSRIQQAKPAAYQACSALSRARNSTTTANSRRDSGQSLSD